ncbi:gamma-glutamyltranspeptidase [Apiospora marii]|uniref:gamma-glutamyltranspeptidase n=1 Tax=Apiospora marii TaxID=335849 RepID=UPI00312E616F
MVLFKSLNGGLVALLASASSAAASHEPSWQQQPDYQTGQAVFPHHSESSQSSAKERSTHGAVASESRTCSQIGIDLLARGGNAVDAWVGTQLCVGVIGMHHSGIGGGGFALVRDADGHHTVIDYRESAPAAAYEGMFEHDAKASVFGGLAAAVPGELRGLEAAHRRLGSLPWQAVVHPAAHVARHGFEVTEDAVRYMDYGVEAAGWDFLVEDPSWAQDFAPGGSRVELGDTMTRKRYADTLDAVAEGGADVFYEGAQANATIAALQAANGTMTLDDMRDYRVILREPINITYGDYRLFSTGAPSSGAVCLNTLKTMEGYHTSEVDANLTLHRFDEAMRFGYAAHQELGDPDFLGPDLARLETRLLSASNAAATRSKILDNATQPVEAYFPVDDDETGNKTHTHPPRYTRSSHGTSHVVTADASGMAVSSTSTVNLLFGNLIMVNATGVILNNEMNDFSIPGVSNEFGYAPSPANFVRPGKRPLSSINPVIIETASASSSSNNATSAPGQLYAVHGAAGGSRIISSTAQVAWRLLESEMASPQKKKKNPTMLLDAIREPRFHDQLMPNTVTVEYAFDNATAASLAARGHNVTWVREGYSSVQGIRVLLGDDVEGGKDIVGFEAAGETRQKNSGGLTS